MRRGHKGCSRPLEDFPVDEEHGDVHRCYGEDDVEPRVLWGGVRSSKKEKPSWAETNIISCSRPFIVTPFTEYRTVITIITQLVQHAGGDGARVNGGDERLVPHERVPQRVRVVPHRGHDQVRALVRGCASCTAVYTQRTVVRIQRSSLAVVTNWLSVHACPAKGPSISPVRPRRRPDEDPLPVIRVGAFPVLEAGLRPRVGKVDEEDGRDEGAPRGAIQSPQKMKKPLGTNQETRMRSSHTTTFGPQPATKGCM